jgi:DNA repair protein RecO (recombination protein O)
MLHKTKGLVLGHTLYKESSIICKIFTEKFGLESYEINGVRNAKSKNGMAFFMPLTQLDLVVYQNQKKEIQRISELKCSFFYHSLNIESKKIAICMFLTEFLQKSLHSHESNQALFEFCESALKVLDGLEKDFEDFHLHFVLKVSQYLGFGTQTYAGFIEILESAGYKINSFEGELIDQLYAERFGLRFLENKSQRNRLLDLLILYYGLFNERFEHFYSIDVLREL